MLMTYLTLGDQIEKSIPCPFEENRVEQCIILKQKNDRKTFMCYQITAMKKASKLTARKAQ